MYLLNSISLLVHCLDQMIGILISLFSYACCLCCCWFHDVVL